MQVVSIADHNVSRRKAELLEILDELRKQVDEGLIEEFVAASMDTDGDVQVHACIKDIAGGIGMFEIGKHILITENA
jgi:hypothetical protein